MTRSREPLSSLVLYRLFKWSIITPTFYTYFQGRVHGIKNVPLKDPVIVVSNHGSYFDPPILATCIERPVAFMAKEELFRVPLLKQGIKLYGAYPVKRGAGDRAAIRAAIASAQEGWGVGIFLQGTRTPDGRITEPKLGAAMIAAKIQAPILPVSLWGTDKILVPGSPIPRPVPLTVRIGELLDPPKAGDRDDLKRVTKKCQDIINLMHALGR